MELEFIPITNQADSGKYIVYRPLTGLAFVGNKALVNLIQSLGDDSGMEIAENQQPAVTFLEQVGFFRPDPPPPNPIGEEFHPTTAVLLLTNHCQLRCTYCYAAAGEAPRHDFTFELGKIAIDHVYEQALELGEPFFHVSFHGGGEPTYAWSVLKDCTDYARQKDLPAKISLTSNGVWSPAQTMWIINNVDEVSLSLDGSPRTQDENRPLMNGQGSSEFVMRSVAQLDKHGRPYGIRMTVTAPWDRLPEDIRYLCETTRVYSIQAEPAFNTGRGGHGQPEADEAQEFIDAFMEASQIATEHGRNLSYSGARLGVVTTTFCTAPFSALIVDASGHLVTCYEVNSPTHPLSKISIIGQIKDGEVKVHPQSRKKLHGKLAERRSNCKGCHCYWSCAGDCYVQVFTKDNHLEYGARCKINRTITEKLLLRRIADGGGVWQAPHLQGASLTLG